MEKFISTTLITLLTICINIVIGLFIKRIKYNKNQHK